MNRTRLLFPICAAAALLCGCRDEETVQRYRVPRPPAVVKETKDRMLAAIVPHDDQGWFFKVAGPKHAVGTISAPFESFVKSVRFPDADGKPQWILPEGWTLQASSGSDLRFATIKITSEPPLELTVTTLPYDGQDPSGYVLSNLNRWRGQMQLGPIEPAQLAAQTTEVALEASTATLVDLEGNLSSGGMGRGPFAGGPMTAPATRPIPPAAAQQAAADSIDFDLPPGWVQSANDTFSKLAFDIKDGDKKLRITITALAAAAGDLTSNINRWRGQVGLPPVSAQEIPKITRPIQVGSSTGYFVELVGAESASPRQTLLGVIVADQGQAWFIKLVGDAELAEREKTKFESFVSSLKLPD